MVEIDRWGEGLARVSIVNYNGAVLMDKYVIPDCHKITNYRTWVSGVSPENLKLENGAIKYAQAKKEAHAILKDKIIVGHSLSHDFAVLELSSFDKWKIRDLVKFRKYQNSVEVSNQLAKVGNQPQQTVKVVNHGAKSLKKLSKEFLGVCI